MCKIWMVFACLKQCAYMMVMKYVGVDGCKGGWLVAAITGKDIEIAVVRSFNEIWAAHRDAKAILVDVPIGLPSAKNPSRKADSLARRILGHRHACVFSPGVRAVNYCSTYAEACEANRKLTGKKISLQYWGIVPKVKEVDEFLITTPVALDLIREAHPEVCFAMAGGRSMEYGKKTADGIDERLAILDNYMANASDVYRAALKAYPRKEVARDDIVDALMLAVTARESRGEIRSLPSPLEADEENLLMAIWYHEFTR
ncbi:DUF429 domain-containing protein [Pseudodesulfovibrio sp.]|nr:DUF429 domain-containing protein [Pseudodesulfovibrio sp.]